MNFSHAPRSSQPFDMSSATASVFGACRAASAARVEFYSFTLRSERLFGQAPRPSLWLAAGAGVLLGAAAVVKQTAIFEAAPLAAFLLFSPPRKEGLKAFALFA